MDVPDPPSTLLLVGLLCLPFGLTLTLSILSIWDDALSQNDDDFAFELSLSR